MKQYIIKTNKGYYAGIDYNNFYKMDMQSVKGWHTNRDFKYEKMKWVYDKPKAKKLWSNTLKTFFDKLDDLLNQNLEDIDKIEVIIID